VDALQQDSTYVSVTITSDCPNLQKYTNRSIELDAMRELIVPKKESEFYKLLKDHHHSDKCSVYDAVKDAIGRNLARYYEIA